MTRIGLATWLVVLMGASLSGLTLHGQSAQSNPGSYDREIAAARRLTGEKQFRKAIDVAERAIKRDANRWEAYAAAAEAYLGHGLMDDAIGMLQMALARAPQDKKGSIRELIEEVRKQSSRPAVASSATSAASAVVAPPQPKDMIARGIESIGGQEAIANVKTLVLQFTHTDKDGPSEMRHFILLPDAQRMELSKNGQISFVVVQNGGQAWTKFEREPAEVASYPAPDVWWDTVLNLASGKQKVDSFSIAGDEMTLSVGENDLILDLSTGLVRRTVARWTFQNVPYTRETTYGDYRRIQGLLWPFSRRSISTGIGNSTEVYTLVEFNRTLSPALFERLR
jgi:hypothetical protein